MRLIKYLTILTILLLSVILAAWYYITARVANEINAQYAEKEITVGGVNKNNYFIRFSKAVPSGFPFKISWELHNLKEEGRNTEISYLSPLKFGYDLLKQQVFVDYDGDVKSMYKPVTDGFGAMLKISNCSATAKLPLTTSLINTLTNMEDLAPIINHVGDIHISSGNVKIFDLIDNEKFYDKKYENIKFTFTPAKEYKNLKDLLNHIPQHYTIDYVVNIEPFTSTKIRNLPISLFYGSSMIQAGTDIALTATMKTSAKNIEELRNNFAVKAEASCDIPWLNIRNIKLDYKTINSKKNQTFAVKSSSNLHLKNGAFDALFTYYNNILAPYIKSLPSGETIDKEIQYVITNKDKFKFKELENIDYDIKLTTNSNNSKAKRFMNIDNFSIFSSKSGFKLKHKMEQNVNKDRKWFAEGVLFVKNYPSIVEFSSGYIYRFGKFKALTDDARKLYVDVNTEFLQSIADKTKEGADNNVRFTYFADSRHLNQAKFGSVKAKQIPQLYSLMLYKKLLGKVGYKGDILSKMKNILPDINKDDSLLKKILPKNAKNSTNDGNNNRQVPTNTKDILNKVIGKGKLDPKKLLRNFVK